MDTGKELKPIRVNDPEAIRLVREYAPKQRRSLSGCAAIAIIEILGGSNNTSNAGTEQGKSEVAK